MGLLIEGKWHDQWYDTKSHKGEFIRSESQFRHWVTPDGSAGPTGEEGFKAEAGRYHLYVSLACPWAHRALIMRELKGLQDLISVSVVHPLMLEQGWTFASDSPAATGDLLYGYSYLHQLYTRSQPDYTGRVTVPVLWDKQKQTIVNNESSEIIRMLNSAFNRCGANAADLYPTHLQEKIDHLNSWIYDSINNGVYRVGFATSQQAYDSAVETLFSSLEKLEQKLSEQRYLAGDQMTEADIRLFTTLVRFDPVYVTHFKCDRKRISDYPSLSGYLRELYQIPGIAESVNMTHIREHYYRSHPMLNPQGIISTGPEFDLNAAHGREIL
ncbi:glutathione S-transferase family protein [uncultured Neptuniibacter sp.]|jgi:putative glutathione S-transferase|uniref:glutathione S-transferase family protein n=1 Tax=uncultured Neptuniibacter sp. TaxID=502143 RepID=UPI0026342189|nr:glutathione S-transferase family protein [uncultured Neptuniibacter sp.]